MSDVLLTEDEGHVRIIQLNRPEKKNALNDELAWGVLEAIEQAIHDDSVWVIGITGSGDAFCSGLDLSGQGDGATPLTSMESRLDDIGWVGRFLLTIRDKCDKPVVGGINGVAVGAGLGLAMATDIRIAAEGARLMAGYTRIGGSPDGGLTFTLPQAIGYEKAMRFMLENRSLSGREAFEEGLVGEVVDDLEFGKRLREYCQSLAVWSPFSMRMTKRGMHRAVRGTDLEGQMRFELLNILKCFSTEDAKEARQAFFEKRQPVFKGK
jgi:2-(1,2-epoxy-1,2-dihydrophenyl)acetyl-CoA isomerase